MLPPFVHDTLKWLRNETVLPAGAAAEPYDESNAPDAGAGAYAAPLAAGIAGACGAAALLACHFLRLPSFAVAASEIDIDPTISFNPATAGPTSRSRGAMT